MGDVILRRFHTNCHICSATYRTGAVSLLHHHQVEDTHEIPVPVLETASRTVISNHALQEDADNTCVSDRSGVSANIPASHKNDLPKHIGKYQVVAELGRGGMGAVYEAFDPDAKRRVAVKVLNHIAAEDESATRRFHKEARLLAEVNNPWVTNLLDSGDHAGSPFLVIEFVDGIDLRAVLKADGPFPEHQALMIVSDVARALQPAHERGIVHRDIKPGNILLSPTTTEGSSSDNPGSVLGRSFHVRLADFGLARHIDQTESLQMTQTGAFMGTPVYMSPEQCKGTGEISAETDIYAIGIMLFEMLTGKPPFAGDDAMQLASKHCFEKPPSITKINPDISDATQHIVMKALAKHQSSRYASATELLDAIECVLHGESTTAEQHPVLPSTIDNGVQSAECEWQLNSAPEQLWAYVSDTERINEALGLPPVEFTDHQGENGLRRFGMFKLAGMSIEWEEHPFEWIEGRRFSVLRDFSKGPFDWFTNTVTLEPRADGGTMLKHSIRIRPKGLIGRLVAKMEVDVKAKKSLDKVYSRIDRVISSSNDRFADPFRTMNVPNRSRRRRMQERLDRLLNEPIDGAIAACLVEHLSSAPSQEVARMKPKALALRWKKDASETLRVFLFAAHHNLLQLQWDILCPTCRIPSDTRTAMKNVADHGRCEACDANFSLDLAESIELVFRAHPEVRETETKTYCIGGPGHSPHVVAQVSLQSEERFELDLQLPEGEYVLRGPRLPYTVPVSVSSDSGTVRGEIPLRAGNDRLRILKLKTGRQTLTLLNEIGSKLQVRLERTIPRHDVVTAAQAASTPEFRELFPLEAPRHGQLLTIANVSLLLMRFDGQETLTRELGDAAAFRVWSEAERVVRRCVTRAGGVVIRSEASDVRATFDTLEKSIECVRLLHSEASETRAYRPAFALHRGAMLATNTDDRISYFGSILDECRALLGLALPGEILIPVRGPGDDPFVDLFVQEAGAAVVSTSDSSLIDYFRIDLSSIRPIATIESPNAPYTNEAMENSGAAQ